jgi:hypothetical protein
MSMPPVGRAVLEIYLTTASWLDGKLSPLHVDRQENVSGYASRMSVDIDVAG